MAEVHCPDGKETRCSSEKSGAALERWKLNWGNEKRSFERRDEMPDSPDNTKRGNCGPGERAMRHNAEASLASASIRGATS